MLLCFLVFAVQVVCAFDSQLVQQSALTGQAFGKALQRCFVNGPYKYMFDSKNIIGLEEHKIIDQSHNNETMQCTLYVDPELSGDKSRYIRFVRYTYYSKVGTFPFAICQLHEKIKHIEYSPAMEQFLLQTLRDYHNDQVYMLTSKKASKE